MDVLIKKINFIDFTIYKLPTAMKGKQNYRLEWELNRLNWYKNRYVFYFLYVFKNISKKSLSYLCSLKKLDNHLIKIWKVFKFRNICSFNLFLNQDSNKYTNRLCRTPLFSRRFTSIFYIQKYTGCICCSTFNGLGEPIWWDDEKKIRILSNMKFYENNLKIILILSSITKNYLKICNYQKSNFIEKSTYLFYELKKKEINLMALKVIEFIFYVTIKKKKKVSIFKNIYEYIITKKKDYNFLF